MHREFAGDSDRLWPWIRRRNAGRACVRVLDQSARAAPLFLITTCAPIGCEGREYEMMPASGPGLAGSVWVEGGGAASLRTAPASSGSVAAR